MRVRLLETAAFYLICLLAAAMLLCGLLLVLLRVTRTITNLRIQNMRKQLLCLISGEADANRMRKKLYEMLQPGGEGRRLVDIRGIRSRRGLRVISETAEEVDGSAWNKLAQEAGGDWYGAYLSRVFRRSRLEPVLLVTRLTGLLQLSQFTRKVVEQIYYFRSSMQMQHIGMLTLCMLGTEREVVALCRDESIASLLSFRTLEEIFSTYTGDKRRLCRKLITTASDLYIRRTCIKLIGESDYVELGRLVIPFLKSSEFNARIDAVRTLGRLREHEALDLILPMAKDLRWEMRAVVATALGSYGVREHVDTLLTLLCDSEWWVRYRAAEALLRYANRAALLARVENTQDRFALEMMRFAADLEALKRKEAVE